MAPITRQRLFLIVFATMALAFFIAVRTAATAPADVLSADIVLDASDLAGWENDGGLLTGGTLTLAPDGTAALFTSPAIDAPLPFNALVARWGAPPPDDTSLVLYVRTAPSRGEWSDWQEIHPSADLTLPEDKLITGDFVMLAAADGRHEQLQLRAQLYPAPDGAMPRLERVEVTLIDSTAGPTAEEALARAQAQPAATAPDSESGYPKPFVVSRADWCWDSRCNYSEGLSYRSVTHLILHHTVSGGDIDSAAAMRAIWYFHAITRDWGDIGYNYLVDKNGLIYEGHLGGDDVVGTHSGAANTGSMALSMIGDYTSITPPDAMRNAAANLFAWKADQKGIDVYSASRLPEMSWGLPHLSGHRDVYGTTACPGDSGHPWLPWLRDEVARRIGFTPEHIYFDELNPATHFTRSASPWNSTTAIRNCGINGHAWYTWSVTDAAASTNWGEWRPEIPAPGRYELSIFAPYCYTRKSDTHGARYEISHPGGRSNVTIDQGARLGLWTSLGEYSLYAGTSNVLRLTDLTSTDSGYGVWFDAIRVRFIKPGANLQAPVGATVTNPVRFAWSVSAPESLTAQWLQVATDPAFQNLLLDAPLSAGDRSAERSVPHTGGTLYWRLRLISTRGDTIDGTAQLFTLTVDTIPPTSAVTGVFLYSNGHFGVAWRGEDDVSGIAGYNLDYRLSGATTWTRWMTNTPARGGYFVPPQAGAVYWFRSQATDAAGNAEPLHTGNGDANTTQAIVLTDHHFMPLLPR